MDNIKNIKNREFTFTCRIVERIYMSGHCQRVTRTLYEEDECIATEDYPLMSKKGELAKISDSIKALSTHHNNCLGCRYKVGDYTGDVGYLLYLAFRTRIRLKLLKFKIRAFKLLNIPLSYKYKTPSGEKIKCFCGQDNR